MEEQDHQQVERLFEDLQQEYAIEEPLYPEAEKSLHELRPVKLFANRRRAAEELGQLGTSHPRIVATLVELSESDKSHFVRRLAAEVLLAPALQERVPSRPAPRLGSVR
jgi:hypothetical protein